MCLILSIFDDEKFPEIWLFVCVCVCQKNVVLWCQSHVIRHTSFCMLCVEQNHEYTMNFGGYILSTSDMRWIQWPYCLQATIHGVCVTCCKPGNKSQVKVSHFTWTGINMTKVLYKFEWFITAYNYIYLSHSRKYWPRWLSLDYKLPTLSVHSS